MDEGLASPCLELGATAEHGVLAWMSRKANKKTMVVPYEYERLIEQASRGVFGTAHRVRPVEQAIRHLFDEDPPYIGRVDFGATFGFEVLVRCPCGGSSRGNPRKPPPQAVGGAIIMRAAHGDGSGLTDSGESMGVIHSLTSLGVKSESAQKSVETTVTLARDFFPQVTPGDGYSHSKWPALAHHLNQWKISGMSLDTIRLLMEEFGHHPDWCRRSNKPAWRVFLARRDELEALVASQQVQDPVNRKYSTGGGAEFWFGRHTPRSYSPA